MSGVWINVQARASFCFIPPDKAPAIRFLNRNKSICPQQIVFPAGEPFSAVNAGEKIDVLIHAQVAVKGEALGEIPDAADEPGLFLDGVASENAAGSGRGRKQAAEHPDQRGFSGPVRPDEAEGFAPADIQVDAAERLGLPEGEAKAGCLKDGFFSHASGRRRRAFPA